MPPSSFSIYPSPDIFITANDKNSYPTSILTGQDVVNQVHCFSKKKKKKDNQTSGKSSLKILEDLENH